MRKLYLAKDIDFIGSSDAEACGSPFPHSIDSKECGTLERRWIERTRCMGFMMLGKNYFALILQFVFYKLLHPKLFFNPKGHRFNK